MKLFLNVTPSKKQLNDDKDIRVNPVCGVYLVLKMAPMLILVLSREFLTEITQQAGNLKSMYGEATLPQEK
ncbi:hypothetical protein EQ70_21710 [Salmonella enterica subsp. houtenae]|nr:hypothetical protein [Salmonella enterica subsp. houtenae]